MRVPGLGRPAKPVDDRVIVDAQHGGRYVETQPGVVQRSDGALGGAASANDAYAQGRADALADTGRVQDRAYVAGRQDERTAPRRRGRGGLLGSIILLLLVIAGVIWALSAYKPGAVTHAGAIAGNAIDAPLTAAHDQAAGAADAVKARTGQAVENAGQALVNRGEKLKNRGEKLKADGQ